MPFIPPGVDPKIFMGHLDQWEAWGDGADIGPAPHTLEQAASATSTSTSPSSSAPTSTSATPSSTPAHPTSPPIIYTCIFTSDFTHGIDLHFKKGSRARVLQEESLKDGGKVVKIKVDGFVDKRGKVWTGGGVPMVFVEKEKGGEK